MKPRIAITALLIGGLSVLWMAGSLHPLLLESRRLHELSHAEPLENAPPLIVFSTVALGGFSGIIADILWMRAGQLQLEGQYIEMVQLADWITSLQPRFAAGWVYHAWNLAYNISVMFDRPEDRWRWVRHGIELLRDGGLRYNPRNAMLHRELGWFFQHKMAGTTDQAHMFYKYMWAQEMRMLFDGRSPDYYALAQAHRTREELLRLRGMPELVEQLQQAGLDPFEYRWPETDRVAEWRDRLDDSPAGAALLNHLRYRMLRDRYRMSWERMQEIEMEVGPLDWRLPQAHAIYWAWRGRNYAEEGFERLSIDRMIFQNMADAFRQGSLLYDAEEGLFVPSPTPALWPYVLRRYEEAMAEHEPAAIRAAYVNFMNEAMTILYTYNRISDASQIFTTLQERFPDAIGEMSFEEYVLDQFAERMAELGDTDALAFVEGAFVQHFFWLALGDEERAIGFDRLARQAWQSYMAPRMEDPEWLERTGIPAIPEIRRSAREQVRNQFIGRRAQDRLTR